jgi:hypothetical protein
MTVAENIACGNARASADRRRGPRRNADDPAASQGCKQSSASAARRSEATPALSIARFPEGRAAAHSRQPTSALDATAEVFCSTRWSATIDRRPSIAHRLTTVRRATPSSRSPVANRGGGHSANCWRTKASTRSFLITSFDAERRAVECANKCCGSDSEANKEAQPNYSCS